MHFLIFSSYGELVIARLCLGLRQKSRRDNLMANKCFS